MNDHLMDSEVKYIGNIPNNWNLTKIKYISNVIAGGTPSTTNQEYWDGNIPWLDSGKVNYVEINEEHVEKFISEKALQDSSAKLVKKDSVLVAITGATCSKVAYLNFNSTINQSIIGLECNDKVIPKYLFYILTSQSHQILEIRSGGAQGGVTKNDLMNIKIPIPNLIEQKMICEYLDKKTSEINELCLKIEKKIQALTNFKKSYINRLLCLGLDPNVDLKETQISWISKIPSHWNISKIMYITNLVTDGSHFSPEIVDDGKPFITVTNITKDHKIDFNGCLKISEEAFDILSKNGCRPVKNDILITKDGTIGRGTIVQDNNDYVILSSLGLIRFNEKIDPNFGLNFLLSPMNIDQMYSNVRGSGITRLTINLIKNLYFIVPPKEEQLLINKEIEKIITPINSIIKKEEERVRKLIEYKNSVIFYITTGKSKRVHRNVSKTY